MRGIPLDTEALLLVQENSDVAVLPEYPVAFPVLWNEIGENVFVRRGAPPIFISGKISTSI